MGTMASQITSVSIAYSAVCSGTDQTKHPRHWSLLSVCGGGGGGVGGGGGGGKDSPGKASNAENVSIWWRHHS